MGRVPKDDLVALHSKLKSIFDDDVSKHSVKTATKLKGDSILEAEDSAIFSVQKEEDDDYVPCLDRHERLYLRLDEVQDAINVKPYKWGMCALKVWKYWPDSDYYSYMQPIYEDIIENYSEKY